MNSFGPYLARTVHDHESGLATAAGHWALIGAAVTGATAVALACTEGHRKGSEPAETRGGAPVPGAGGTLDHG